MKYLYTLGIYLYGFGLMIAGLSGNSKAIKWLEGRRRWKVKMARKKWNRPIWIHASSLGEFEQAKPLIEKIKADPILKDVQIIITFFSPSGYENSRGYKLVDGMYYLPLDTPRNAHYFLDLIAPRMAIFVRYDFWFNYLDALQARNIPTVFFSCNFRRNQIYFKRTSVWQRTIMKQIDAILCLNKESEQLLLSKRFTNTGICGDTRFDRVTQSTDTTITSIPLIEKFKGDGLLLIVGSSWSPDEKIIAEYCKTNPKIKIIVAPHDISIERIEAIEKLLQPLVKCIRYSKAEAASISNYRVLIVDNIGLLADAYHYSDMAFVGGGFTNDLHNILEPAAAGNAVFYGASGGSVKKYPEALQLEKYDGGLVVKSAEHFIETMHRLTKDNSLLEEMKINGKHFIATNMGATDTVFARVKELLSSE